MNKVYFFILKGYKNKKVWLNFKNIHFGFERLNFKCLLNYIFSNMIWFIKFIKINLSLKIIKNELYGR